MFSSSFVFGSNRPIVPMRHGSARATASGLTAGAAAAAGASAPSPSIPTALAAPGRELAKKVVEKYGPVGTLCASVAYAAFEVGKAHTSLESLRTEGRETKAEIKQLRTDIDKLLDAKFLGNDVKLQGMEARLDAKLQGMDKLLDVKLQGMEARLALMLQQKKK